MLKQTISQKMLQKLSPQQIQLMKLLQVPTALLEQRIKEEMEVNPALEEAEGEIDEDYPDFEPEAESNFSEDGEDSPEGREEEDIYREDPFDLGDYLNEYIEDEEPGYKVKIDSYSGEEDKQLPVAVENTFHDSLEQQLGMLALKDEKEHIIALQLIGSIDDDGYLRREVNAIIDDLMFLQNTFVSKEEVTAVLKKIQRFDPPGIGARDLQECLCIQLDSKLEQADPLDDEHLAALRLARTIMQDYFEEFTKKHYDKLIRQLNITEEDLKAAIDEIIRLNPKPASGYSGGHNDQATQYVVPDFIITNTDGELELALNSRNAPDLRVSDQYRDMLRSYKANLRGRSATRTEKEAVLFIKQKIDSAKWFIDAIKQRQDTLFRTMYAIMQYQYDYFLSGDSKKLRPMILQDIADITGLDISTISRVTSSKFVQTEFGTRRLKDFFSESLQTEEGDEVSTLEVKKILRDLIDAENKRKPLSDEQLTEALQTKGYHIARRTVAKYREQMNMPVARLRKGL
ncbi:MAG: RNA polymerase factor sigma-54 [Saprospiraceae bacterium]|nr:RNA polymerase factor sigma-54 [Saprospiraceae bacterium]